MSWTLEGKYAGRTINVNSKEVPFEYNKFYDIINQDEVSILLELLKWWVGISKLLPEWFLK